MDEERAGHPTTSTNDGNIEKGRVLILNNRRQTIDEVQTICLYLGLHVKYPYQAP